MLLHTVITSSVCRLSPETIPHAVSLTSALKTDEKKSHKSNIIQQSVTQYKVCLRGVLRKDEEIQERIFNMFSGGVV